MVEQFRELLAQERTDDGWRRLIASQSVGVGGTHDGGLQQTVMTIHSHQGLHDEGHETQVFLRCLTRGVE